MQSVACENITRSTKHVCTRLQEVFTSASSALGHRPTVVGHGAEDLERRLQVLSKVHDGSDVAAAVAVVGGGPDGDDIFVFEVVLWYVS